MNVIQRMTYQQQLDFHKSVLKDKEFKCKIDGEIHTITPRIKIGNDNRCLCTCADVCPLNKTGMEYRCTKEELEANGYRTIS